MRYTLFLFIVYMLTLPADISAFISYFTMNEYVIRFEVYAAVMLSLTGLIASLFRFIEVWYFLPNVESRYSKFTASTMSTALLLRKESLFDKIFIDGVTNSLVALTLALQKTSKFPKKVKDIYKE